MMDWTAAQLAEALEGMRNHPHNTGGLSMLEEATLAFASKYPEASTPHRALRDARYAHKRSYSASTGSYSQAAWENAMDAAEALAAALRPLGAERIARCGQGAGWGLCNSPLLDDGSCPATPHHVE